MKRGQDSYQEPKCSLVLVSSRTQAQEGQVVDRKKILEKYVMGCDLCLEITILYCGDCGGAKCRNCFENHLKDCHVCSDAEEYYEGT